MGGSPGCALSELSARVNHMPAVVSMLEQFERVLAGKDDVKVLVKGQRLRAATPGDTHGTANAPATLSS